MGVMNNFKTNDELMERILPSTEAFAKTYHLQVKDSVRLRLLAEETVEMLCMMGNSMPGSFGIDGDSSRCALRFKFDSTAGRDSEGPLRNVKGVSGKISYLLRCSYGSLEKADGIAEEIGVRKARREDLEELGAAENDAAYIWSIDAYNFSSFDKFEEDDNEDWMEISRSIIANLVDDVRIFIFENRKEASIYISFEKGGEQVSAGISPEFEALAKVPVAKNKFQIKLVQLLYNRLPEKQVSTDELEIKKLKISIPSAPKGKLTVLEYARKGLDPDEDAPCVLFLHGGAFVFPALPYHFRLAETVAKRAACRLFLVIHDLGPKYMPPLQNRETLDVYKHLLSEAKAYHINPERIVVMGDSSGGTQAAALTLFARELGLQAPVAQVLLYPSVDDRKDSESMRKYTDVPVINGDAIRFYQELLAPDPEDRRKYYLSPAEVEDLSGLPEAYVETAEFDALHDEGLAYAKQLKAAGNLVTLNETRGTVHAFDMAKGSAILAGTMDKRLAFINRVIHS